MHAYDPYVLVCTEVLKNKVGATTSDDLEQRENDFVFLRMISLLSHPPKLVGTFKQIQDIHGTLFQDVYDWAGELRSVDMSKGGGPMFQPRFTFTTAIRYFESTICKDNLLKGMNREMFVSRLAVNFDNLNMIHPFREGNGRTQRVYWTFMAHEAGWDISWRKVSKQENIQASKSAILGNLQGLENMFNRVVRPYDPESN